MTRPQRFRGLSGMAARVPRLCVRHNGRCVVCRGACVAAMTVALAAASAHAQELLSIDAHQPSTDPTLVCFSPDGRVLATNGDVTNNGPAGMRLWEAKSGKMILDITTWKTRTTELATFNIGLDRYRLMLRERWREELGHCFSVAFTPDGMTLAWGNGGGVNAWYGRTGDIKTLQTSVREDGKSFTIGNEAYHYMAISPDGSTVAAAGPKWSYVAVWDTLTGIQRASWKAVPSGGMRAIAFSPKGPYLAVIGCEDPRVHIWDLNTGKLRRSFGEAENNFRALAFSFDGKRLAAAGKKVRAWNWLSNEEIGPLDGFENAAQCAAFVPRSSVLMTGSRDGHLRAWDLAVAKQVATQLAHSGANTILTTLPGDNFASPSAGGVTSLALSKDARRLATAGWDGNVKIWDTSNLLPSRTGKRAARPRKK